MPALIYIVPIRNPIGYRPLLAVTEPEHRIPRPSPAIPNVTRTLSKSHLIVPDRHSATQASATASSGTLALAPLPRTRDTTHATIASCPRRDTCSRSGIRAGSVWAHCTMVSIPRGPESRFRCTAVSQTSAAVASASTQGPLERSHALAQILVLCFDELHFGLVGGGVGVVLRGYVDALAWALGGRWQRLGDVVWRSGQRGSGSGVAVVSRDGGTVR
jgi:hypothetical protein